MTSTTIREKYLNFFKEREHEEIKASPLVLENDPTTLFTSAGMQQLAPYLEGKNHPKGKRLVNSQPSLRTQDIEEVGDNRHTTFFEMLGNWSLGDYFKEEQLAWCFELYTKEIGLPKEKLFVTVFKGEEGVEKDEKSAEIWKKLGVPEKKIFYYGVKENWWSMSGSPTKMKTGDIGGPDSEIFYEFDQVKHQPKYGKECHPNCQCGRYLEIGNSVFIQYKKEKDSLIELPQKNVDFGGGLERIAAAVNNDPDVFKTDVFEPYIERIEKTVNKKYDGEDKENFRIIADHLRASEALIKEGMVPGNKLQGYVLRRLIRRAALKMRILKGDLEKKDLNLYFEEKVSKVVEEEVERFNKSLERGLREVEKTSKVDGKKAFDFYQTYGFPLEITLELFKEKGQKIKKEDFEKEFQKHQETSRSASSGIFKGGLVDESSEAVRFHTATHLLHASLRKVLGDKVKQKGSNITKERLRFDFSYPQKLTESEIQKVEELINQQVEKDLPVTFEEKSLKDALDEGALAFFGDRYEEKVKVYTIGTDKEWFSKEVCGGPHVIKTSEVGRVRIKKQEKIGTGTIRLYAVSE